MIQAVLIQGCGSARWPACKLLSCPQLLAPTWSDCVLSLGKCDRADGVTGFATGGRSFKSESHRVRALNVL